MMPVLTTPEITVERRITRSTSQKLSQSLTTPVLQKTTCNFEEIQLSQTKEVYSPTKSKVINHQLNVFYQELEKENHDKSTKIQQKQTNENNKNQQNQNKISSKQKLQQKSSVNMSRKLRRESLVTSNKQIQANKEIEDEKSQVEKKRLEESVVLQQNKQQNNNLLELSESTLQQNGNVCAQEQFQPKDSTMMGCVCSCLSASNSSSQGCAPLGREKEYDNLNSILEDCFQQSRGSAIYISGLPGTGKTMTVNQVLKSVEQRNSTSEQQHAPLFIKFNCCSAGKFGGLFGTIHNQYIRACNQQEQQLSQQQYSQNDNFDSIQLSEQEHFDFLQKLVTSQIKKSRRRSSIGCKSRRRSSICSQSLVPQQHGMIVVVMDEMDFIVNKDTGQQLQQLLELCFEQNSRLIVIGISNQLDLPEKHLANFQANLKTIQFNAYSDPAVMEKILLDRLSTLPWEVIDGKALNFMCREVCRNSGDMRMALKIIQAAVEALVDTPFNVVNISVAMGIVQNWMDKQHCQTIEVIQNLPQQHQILLACLIKSTIDQERQSQQEKQSKKRRRLSLGKQQKKGAFTQRWILVQDLHKCCEQECQRLQIGEMNYWMVQQVCEAIQDGANLVRIKKGNGIENFKVALTMDIDVIKHAFKDCVLISNIYS